MIPWRRKWQPIPDILARKIPGTEEPGRLQSMKESDMTDYTAPKNAGWRGSFRPCGIWSREGFTFAGGQGDVVTETGSLPRRHPSETDSCSLVGS